MRLLALGADPNSQDTQGRTPLLAAASAEGPAVIRALLEAGADPHALTNDGASALHRAAVAGIPEIIPILADAGVDPNGLNELAQAPLHLVVIPSRSNRWWYPYGNEATRSPTALRASALLEAGADPNARNRRRRHSPAPVAVAPRLDPGTRTRTRRADVDARNDKGETPLRVARAQGRRSTIRALLRLGADPDARDNSGQLADPVCYSGSRRWDSRQCASRERPGMSWRAGYRWMRATRKARRTWPGWCPHGVAAPTLQTSFRCSWRRVRT